MPPRSASPRPPPRPPRGGIVESARRVVEHARGARAASAGARARRAPAQGSDARSRRGAREWQLRVVTLFALGFGLAALAAGLALVVAWWLALLIVFVVLVVLVVVFVDRLLDISFAQPRRSSRSRRSRRRSSQRRLSEAFVAGEPRTDADIRRELAAERDQLVDALANSAEAFEAKRRLAVAVGYGGRGLPVNSSRCRSTVIKRRAAGRRARVEPPLRQSALVLQHIACEPPGVFEDVLRERGVEIPSSRARRGRPAA